MTFFVCSKCGRLLSMDKQSAILLPPVQRPYRNFSAIRNSSKKDELDVTHAYHIGCFSDEL